MPGLVVEKLARYHDRAMTSFIVDDVLGQTPDSAVAFRAFRDACAERGLRGECSLILGLKRDEQGAPLPLHPDYARDAREAEDKKIFDAYMEIMTHSFLFDFNNGWMSGAGPHEGVWLLDETVEPEAYQNYFRHIVGMAAQYDLKVTGLTIPGCGCAACVAHKKSRRIAPLTAAHLNPGVTQALLGLALKKQLATPIACTFMGTVKTGPADAVVLAENGVNAVYDVPPGIGGDYLGRWDNELQYVDVDQYITADGAGGRLAELLALETRTLVYYGHWQGLRPDHGVGFQPFLEVARRLQTFYGEEIEWMRPSAIAAYTHAYRHTQVRTAKALLGAFSDVTPGAEPFELRTPFAPSHPLSLRVRGAAQVKLRMPNKKMIAPWKSFPAEGCAIFDLVPENGRYEIIREG